MVKLDYGDVTFGMGLLCVVGLIAVNDLYLKIMFGVLQVGFFMMMYTFKKNQQKWWRLLEYESTDTDN